MYKIKYRNKNDLKNSNIDWIGSIPKRWNIIKIKMKTEITMGQSPNVNDVNQNKEGIAFYQGKGEFGKVNPIPVNYCTKPIKTADIYDILISVRASVGEINIANEKCCIGRGLAAIKVGSNELIKYQLIHLKDVLQSISTRTTFKAINVQQLSNLVITDVDKSEQQKIANFLDFKTAEFDNIIQKKEQLIQKLKQAKKSLVYEIITGKLDIVNNKLVKRDISEMKNSGIKGLGLIPKQWTVSKMKYDTYVKERIGWQGLKTNEFTNEGPYLVTGTDFKENSVDWEKCYRISEKRYLESPEIHLKNDDLLITKDGTIGKLSIVHNCPQKAILNSGLFLIRCKNNMYLTKFMYYILSSETFKTYVDMNSTGSTVKHLYQETFVNFAYGVPDIKKQKQLIKKIDSKVESIDNIIKVTCLQIEKFRQAKKSLIAEAVTGKIDLTDWEIK